MAHNKSAGEKYPQRKFKGGRRRACYKYIIHAVIFSVLFGCITVDSQDTSRPGGDLVDEPQQPGGEEERRAAEERAAEERAAEERAAEERAAEKRAAEERAAEERAAEQRAEEERARNNFAAMIAAAEDINTNVGMIPVGEHPQGEITMLVPEENVSGQPISTAEWVNIENIDADDEGAVDFLSDDEILSCTSEEVELGVNSGDGLAIMSMSAQSIIYPGVIFDGRSFETGEYRPLAGGVRNKINIFIDHLGVGRENTSATIMNPGLPSQVAEGIRDLILEIENEPPRTGLEYSNERFHSESQLMTNFGFHAGVAVPNIASLDVSVNNTNSIDKTYTQEMFKLTHAYFTVSVDPPGASDGDPDTPDGPYIEPPSLSFGTVPVYVSSVTYGRTAIAAFRFTADTSENSQDISTQLAVAIQGIEANTAVESGSSSSASSSISNFRAVAFGGQSDEVSTITSLSDFYSFINGDLTNAFAVPIAYTIKRLDDDSIVQTVLSTTYVRRSCEKTVNNNARAVFVNPLSFVSSTRDETNVYGQISVEVVDSVSGGNATGECRINTSSDNGYLIFNRTERNMFSFSGEEGNLINPIYEGPNRLPLYIDSASGKALVICANLTLEDRAGNRDEVVRSKAIRLDDRGEGRYFINTRNTQEPRASLIEDAENLRIRTNPRFDFTAEVQVQANCVMPYGANSHSCLPRGVRYSACTRDSDCLGNSWCDNLPQDADGTINPIGGFCAPKLELNRLCGVPNSSTSLEDRERLHTRCKSGLCQNSWCSRGGPGAAGWDGPRGQCGAGLLKDTGWSDGDATSDVCEIYRGLNKNEACTQDNHCLSGNCVGFNYVRGTGRPRTIGSCQDQLSDTDT